MRSALVALGAAVIVASACGGAPATSPAVAAPTSAAAAAPSTPKPLVKLSVGYASLSGTQAAAWVAKEKGIFTKNGLDVTLESIAGGSSPTAALIADQIQALQISVEAVSATLEGAPVLVARRPPQDDRDAQGRRRRAGEVDPEAIAYEIQHPAETQEIIGKYTKTTDPALLKETYDTLVPYLNKVPTPKPEQVATALELIGLDNPKAKGADPAKFVDPSFVQALEKAGFIDSLYR